ncbi:aldo/keto reductase [Streptomyces rishiriensis]|uniref:aldo/keto reductase n=1 Tax=Streptomyces rishiriensis TaxID=68264 RepID=UPI003F4D3206
MRHAGEAGGAGGVNAVLREQLPWGTGSDLGESARVLDRFADAGGTFIDTAESYQAAESEEILGLLRTRRDRFTLATKFAIGIDSTSGVQGTGNSRQTMIRAVEGSLARLRTDRVDLLWVHFPDPVTPRGDPARAGRSGAVREDPLRGAVDLSGLAHRACRHARRVARLGADRGRVAVLARQQPTAQRRPHRRAQAQRASVIGRISRSAERSTRLYSNCSTEGRLTTLGQLVLSRTVTIDRGAT